MTSFSTSQKQAWKKRFRVTPLTLALGQMTWALAAVAAPSQTFILHPTTAPALRIDFNYNFQNALPPFSKEPALPGKEVARGLIPTVPPTPLLRIVTDNELRLNTDHTQDFVNGKVATHRSFYRGHVVFTNLAVTSIRDGLEIPYALDLFTYERFCAGWLDVRSGWHAPSALLASPRRLCPGLNPRMPHPNSSPRSLCQPIRSPTNPEILPPQRIQLGKKFSP